jgi:hypothetical protein
MEGEPSNMRRCALTKVDQMLKLFSFYHFEIIRVNACKPMGRKYGTQEHETGKS